MTLSNEHAADCRRVRPRLNDITRELDQIAEVLGESKPACDHARGEGEFCAICSIFALVAQAESVVSDACEEMDKHLERGPHPLAVRRKVP